MCPKIIFYTFPQRDYFELNSYLVKFKSELSAKIKYFSELEIINGNIHFKNTYHFIDYLINLMSTEIDFDNMCNLLRYISKNDIQFIRGKFPQTYRFIENNNHIDISEIAHSLRIKTFISLGGSKLNFKGQHCAHGLSEANGRYAVVIKLYKNIIWHEAAHLFGADDHYNENDPLKMKEKCSDKEFCIMQFDPGDKLCSFCSTALKEITNNMLKKPNVPLHIDNLK